MQQKCDDANVWNKQMCGCDPSPYGPCAKFQELTMEQDASSIHNNNNNNNKKKKKKNSTVTNASKLQADPPQMCAAHKIDDSDDSLVVDDLILEPYSQQPQPLAPFCQSYSASRFYKVVSQ
jgi:hypothetical protein